MNTTSCKTALLFPGLDAFFSTATMKRWITQDFIIKKLALASEILGRLSNEDEDLRSLLINNKRIHLADFDRTLIILTTLQVAIFEEITKHHDWDIAQGCSHGDLARNVACGVLPFEDVIEILWTFSQLRQDCPDGFTANIRTQDLSPITKEQIEWLEGKGAPVSQWSKLHGTIAGETSLITDLRSEAKERGLKIKPVLPYPVHSPAMNSMMVKFIELAPKWKLSPPKKKIFSSLWLKYLTTTDDISKEGLSNFVSPVLWTKTLSYLHHKENVTRFLNIGPANTLTSWIMESPEYEKLEIIDAWEALGLNE
jgi:acyl transferase domain-containing protein